MGLLSDLYRHHRTRKILEHFDEFNFDFEKVEEELQRIDTQFGPAYSRKLRSLLSGLGILRSGTQVSQEAANSFAEQSRDLAERAEHHYVLHPILLGKAGEYIKDAIGYLSAFSLVKDIYTGGNQANSLAAQLGTLHTKEASGFIQTGVAWTAYQGQMRATLRKHGADSEYAEELSKSLFLVTGQKKEAEDLGKKLIRAQAVFANETEGFWEDINRQTLETGRSQEDILDDYSAIYGSVRETSKLLRATRKEQDPTLDGSLAGLARQDLHQAIREIASDTGKFPKNTTLIAGYFSEAARWGAKFGSTYSGTLQLSKSFAQGVLSTDDYVSYKLGKQALQEVRKHLAQAALDYAPEQLELVREKILAGYVGEQNIAKAKLALEAYNRGERAWSSEEFGKLYKERDIGLRRYVELQYETLRQLGSVGAKQVLSQRLGSTIQAELVWTMLEQGDFGAAVGEIGGTKLTGLNKNDRQARLLSLEQEMEGVSTNLIQGSVAKALQVVEHPMLKAAGIFVTLARQTKAVEIIQQSRVMFGIMGSAIKYGLAAGVSPAIIRGIAAAAFTRSSSQDFLGGVAKFKSQYTGLAAKVAAGAGLAAGRLHSEKLRVANSEEFAQSDSTAEREVGIFSPDTAATRTQDFSVRRPTPAPVSPTSSIRLPQYQRKDPLGEIRKNPGGGMVFTPPKLSKLEKELEKRLPDRRKDREERENSTRKLFAEMRSPYQLLLYAKLLNNIRDRSIDTQRASIAISRLLFEKSLKPTGPEFVRAIGILQPELSRPVMDRREYKVIEVAQELQKQEGRQIFLNKTLSALGGTGEGNKKVFFTVPGFTKMVKTAQILVDHKKAP